MTRRRRHTEQLARGVLAWTVAASCAAGAQAQRAMPTPAPTTAPAPVEAPAPAVEPPAPAADAAPPVDDAAQPRGLEARSRKLSDALAVALKRLPGDHRDQVFAVLPFDEVGEEAKQRQLGLVVSDLVVTNLARDHRVPLAERKALAKILDEQALGALGAVDPTQVAEVGKLAGVRALVVGQVSEAGPLFIVSARLVDAESAAVLATADMQVPKEELIAMSSKSLVLRSKSGAMFRSLVVPGWGQAYNDEPIKAFIVGGTFGTVAALTLVTGGVAAFTGFVVYPQVGLKKDARPDDPFDSFVPRGETPAETQRLAQNTRDAANLEFGAAAVLLGITATVWALAAADAYISGTDVESLDKALATN